MTRRFDFAPRNEAVQTGRRSGRPWSILVTVEKPRARSVRVK